MTNPDVLAKRLLQRAHNRDGLPEILIGILFLSAAGLSYAISVLPHRSPAGIAAILLFSFGFPAATFLAPRAIKSIRRRYLVEREGYVEHLPTRASPLRRQWLIGIAAAVIVLAQVVLRPLSENLIPGLTGVLGGALAAICGREPRFIFAGAVMAITGIAVFLSGLTMETGLIVIFAIQGAVEVISGSIVWMRFRAETNER